MCMAVNAGSCALARKHSFGGLACKCPTAICFTICDVAVSGGGGALARKPDNHRYNAYNMIQYGTIHITESCMHWHIIYTMSWVLFLALNQASTTRKSFRPVERIDSRQAHLCASALLLTVYA